MCDSDPEAADLKFWSTDGTWKPGPLCSEEGMDLARLLLAVDPISRLSLSDALCHPFFSLPPSL
jgi:serine/threonine protein kinase